MTDGVGVMILLRVTSTGEVAHTRRHHLGGCLFGIPSEGIVSYTKEVKRTIDEVVDLRLDRLELRVRVQVSLGFGLGIMIGMAEAEDLSGAMA